MITGGYNRKPIYPSHTLTMYDRGNEFLGHSLKTNWFKKSTELSMSLRKCQTYKQTKYWYEFTKS